MFGSDCFPFGLSSPIQTHRDYESEPPRKTITFPDFSSHSPSERIFQAGNSWFTNIKKESDKYLEKVEQFKCSAHPIPRKTKTNQRFCQPHQQVFIHSFLEQKTTTKNKNKKPENKKQKQKQTKVTHFGSTQVDFPPPLL